MNQTKQRHKSNKIGSIKNGKINYPKDQKFFHNTDIPEEIQKIVRDVKYETDVDVLKRHPPKWNASVHLEKIPDLKDVYFKI